MIWLAVAAGGARRVDGAARRQHWRSPTRWYTRCRSRPLLVNVLGSAGDRAVGWR